MRKLDEKTTQVISIAKDCIAFVEKMASSEILNGNQKELAMVRNNHLVIEARLILRGKGPTAEANTEHLKYTNLGI